MGNTIDRPPASVDEAVRRAFNINSERLKIESSPYNYQVAEGNIANHTSVIQMGHNELLADTWETVYNGSDLYTYLTSAERLQVISSDADDTSGGSGARTLTLQGLDGNYAVIEETITLNGNVGHVQTNASFLRLQGAFIATAGATGINEGTISIKNAAAAVTLDQIEANEGEMHSAIFCVPAGNTFYMTQLFFSEESNKGVEFGLFSKASGGAWRDFATIVLEAKTIVIPISFPIPFAEKTDIELRAMGTTVDAIVTAGFEGWYET